MYCGRAVVCQGEILLYVIRSKWDLDVIKSKWDLAIDSTDAIISCMLHPDLAMMPLKIWQVDSKSLNYGKQ